MFATRESWYRNTAVGCTIAVGALSLLPDVEVISSRATIEPDHLLAYWLLTLCWLLSRAGAHAVVLTSVIAYGWALELLQIGVPGRSFEWLDGAANMLGAVAGWGSVLIWRKLTRRGV